MRRHPFPPLAAMMLSATLALPARADAPENKAAAQLLFEQGRELVMDKKFGEACPKFAESLRLDHGIGTMLWLADCYENNGQTASAWAQFKEAAAAASMQGDPREKVARKRVAALETRLSTLRLLPPPEGTLAGLEVRRDGIPLGAAELGIPIPVDPGIHAIAASAPGLTPWSTTVQVPASPGSVSVTIPALQAAPGSGTAASAGSSPEAAAIPAPQGPAESAPPEAPSPRASSTQRTVGIIAAGTGVVALGAGIYFGFHSKATYDTATSSGHCLPDNECDASGKQTRSDASTQATASTVLFIVAAAAIGGGAVLYFTAPRRAPAVAVAPVGGPHWAGLSLSRAW